MAPDEIIKYLQLEPLTVEGGHFREVYRSPHGTCIYYLLTGGDISAWHKVKSDEIWLYHAGTPARQMLLYPDGTWEERVIGTDFADGQMPQSLIPGGTWQAAVPLERKAGNWGLFAAIVFPAFEYSDFVAGSGAELARQYPPAAARMREIGLC